MGRTVVEGAMAFGFDVLGLVCDGLELFVGERVFELCEEFAFLPSDVVDECLPDDGESFW